MSVALLEARGLGVTFRRGRRRVEALSDVGIAIGRGESVGIVGESGSGKTTLARVFLGLQEATAGDVLLEGRSIGDWVRRDRAAFRRRVQMVFQDPYGSLNPRLSIGSALAEVLRVHRLVHRGEEMAAVAELLRSVGLDSRYADRFPHEFSGGQRQRVGIARALATRPEVLIADEPVSALDVSVQAQVLNLLRDLQRERGLTLLLIAHDLAAVRYVCDRVVVMHEGRVVEAGESAQVLDRPVHPYTKGLLAAVPELGEFA
ncbi:MAG: ATP-binding cassette domain-containing protein [Kiritimatiellae bacterium]|nr:ATP-binding cassette domain-containing protein [Kiritimatiellia bacterium]